MRVWAPQRSFQHQPAAELDQANPVMDTWYTILDTAGNVQLIYLAVRVLDVGEQIGVRITIDGQVYVGGLPVSADNWYYVLILPTPGVLVLGTTVYNVGRYESLQGRQVLIEMRKTTNNGNGNLQGRVTWAKL